MVGNEAHKIKQLLLGDRLTSIQFYYSTFYQIHCYLYWKNDLALNLKQSYCFGYKNLPNKTVYTETLSFQFCPLTNNLKNRS